MEKLAVIDMGTNSIRLLTCELDNKKIINRKKRIITTRLGEKVDKNKELTKRAIVESFNAIKNFNAIIRDGNYTLIKIIATSAMRDANNSDGLIKKIKNEIGLDIEIIDGKEEAEYGFKGVSNAFDFDKCLVIDIGGGSTELILGDKHINISDSLNIGAVRMTDKCIYSDPINHLDLKKLIYEIDKVLIDFFNKHKEFQFDKVVGIGGTITTIGAINLMMKDYNSESIQGSIVSIDKIDLIIDRFVNKNNYERTKIIGLQPKRADIILAGTMILKRIMNLLKIEEIIISDYDNLEGIIYGMLV